MHRGDVPRSSSEGETVTSILARVIAATKWLFVRPCDRGLRYWITALVFLFVSVRAMPLIYEYLDLSSVRSKLFERLAALGPRPLEPYFVKVVLLDDDDYWKGEPAGRRPINRNYLAGLVTALNAADAQVIALDFDLRLPGPDVMEIPPEFRAETKILIGAIINAAENGKKVVLAKTIWTDEQGAYVFNPDAYQAYGLCVISRGTEAGAGPSPGGSVPDPGSQSKTGHTSAQPTTPDLSDRGRANIR